MPSFENSDEQCARLVRIAKDLLNEHGFDGATLSEVAVRARLPLDSVLLHFRSKEELVHSAILFHERAVSKLLASCSAEHADPMQRLFWLVRELSADRSPVLFGGHHDRLCTELAARFPKTSLGGAGARLTTLYLDWATMQLRSSGAADRQARILAEQLISTLQGTALIASAIAGEELRAQLSRIELWLERAVALD